MTAPTKQQLQAQITGTERAIRHLIGERAALTSKIKRAEALLKLEQSRLGALVHPNGTPLTSGSRFPDVSGTYQPNVNLLAVRNASSVRVGEMLLTKISEGPGWIDPRGDARMRMMSQFKFAHRGAYHFLRPSAGGAEQAQHMLRVLDDGGVVIRPSDILVCDCEVSDGRPATVIARCARDFALELRKHVPAQIWLYGGGPFLHANGVSLDGYDGHHLAAYVSNPAPYMVFGRARTRAWQYTDGKFGPNPHYCPGIGNGDMSIVL